MAFLSHWRTTKGIHIMAIDGIVTVNSLFTIAVFLGLTTSDAASTTLLVAAHSPPRCIAGKTIVENLVSFHIYSFTCFLFSSLVASALKQALKFRTREEEGDDGPQFNDKAHVNMGILRLGIMISATGSVFGCGFLTLALVALVEIKLGTLACWRSTYSLAAVIPLVLLVPSALLIYVGIIIYAFTR